MAAMRCFGGRDLIGILEHGKSRRVAAFLAMFEPDQFAALARERFAQHMIVELGSMPMAYWPS